jgi:transcriptional regulator with XRE-family HTH domain
MLLAENVRRRREEQGWTMSRLFRETGVSMSTLRRVERGLGCTPLVERKLAKALRTAEGRLWQRYEWKKTFPRPAAEARWHFIVWEECQRYLRRQGLSEERDPFPYDPESIQDEAERLRLGRNGLSTAFFRLTSGVFAAGSTVSSVLELFGTLPGSLEEGTFGYFYCLRGGVRVGSGAEVVEMVEHDALNIEYESPSYLEPSKPVGPNDLPPLLIFVDADSYRRVPHPSRGQSGKV